MVTRADFATIVPVLIVTLAACAALLAEALRRKGDRVPAGHASASSASSARRITSIQQWGQHRVGLRRDSGRRLRAVRQRRAVRRRPADDPAVAGARPSATSCPRASITRSMLFSIAGMMLMGVDARSADRVHRARDHVARRLRADGHQAQQRGRRRGRVQVFRARRVLERVLPVRHRARLRRHRIDQARRDRPGRGLVGSQPDILLDPLDDAAARRPRVQGVGRAVPHVDAGRLPGRADARDRRSCPPASRPRRSRRSSASSCPRSSRMRADWVPDSVRDRRPDDGGRHGRRRGAVERQAHARVLEHRARRLPADRSRGRERGGQGRRCCSTWRPTP